MQVRNPGDTASSIWINGRNRIGSQHGPIVFAFGSSNDGGYEVGRFETVGNLVLVNDLIMENRSLKAKLADIEARLSGLEIPFSVIRLFLCQFGPSEFCLELIR